MSVCDLTINVGAQPLDPITHLPLMKMTYSNTILEEKFATAGSLDFFTPEVQVIGQESLAISHSIRVRAKKYRNPFKNVAISEVQYEAGESCPPVMSDQCDPGCVSSENEWDYFDVKFKNKMRVGVSWCVESEKLLYQDAESRWNESIEDYNKVSSAVGWSELICQAIDAPATTKLPAFKNTFPTHFFDAGDSDRYEVLTQVFNYMQRMYQGRWNSEFMILADPQLELDLADLSAEWHAWNKTGITTALGNVDKFVAGGWQPMQLLPKLWAKPIMIAPDVIDYYPEGGALDGDNLNPFQNSTGSKYYVVIVSKRAYYHGNITLMDKQYFPATCENKYSSIQQTWLSFYKLLFPSEIFVVAFNNRNDFSS